MSMYIKHEHYFVNLLKDIVIIAIKILHVSYYCIWRGFGIATLPRTWRRLASASRHHVAGNILPSFASYLGRYVDSLIR